MADSRTSGGPKPRHKYDAVPTFRGGIRFDSKAEAEYYDLLVMRCGPGGDVLFFLRQVRIDLPGATRLVIDFLEFHRDGSCHAVDVKGFETETFRLKKRQVEALYPGLVIEVVKMKGGEVESRTPAT